jgi:hypothetical protein
MAGYRPQAAGRRASNEWLLLRRKEDSRYLSLRQEANCKGNASELPHYDESSRN